MSNFKHSFKINLPTIPGKPIRLKIEDVKRKGFVVKETRFKEDKSKLADSFIQLFDNLHHPATPSVSEDKDQVQTVTTRATFTNYAEELHFRFHVPDYKNGLVEILQRQQQSHKKTSSTEQSVGGKTTAEGRRVGKSTSVQQSKEGYLDKVKKRKEAEDEERLVMENYYFRLRQEEKQKREMRDSIHQKPSAVFMNESRNRVFNRVAKADIVPGPGYYSVIEPKKSHEHKETENVQPRRHDKSIERINLKDQTIKMFQKHHIELEEKKEEEEVAKPVNPQYMFIQDDRDRFGNQRFPIVLKLNNPGPGAYEPVDTIEERSKKVIVLQQQRKLLKDWFNQ